MLPQVAQYPPQQVRDRNSSAPPLPLNNPQSQTQNTPTPTPPLPFRTHEQSPFSLRPPQHRTYPVESFGAPRAGIPVNGSSGSAGYGGQYSDPSEHMLRRKTPNGTLAAGYDGTPVKWSSKPPALKHVLLPLSTSQHGQALPASTNGSEPKQRANSLGRSRTQGPLYAPNSMGSGMRLNSDPGNWAYPLHNSNPAANIWDQISMGHIAYNAMNNSIQVPTVLQPPYQHSPGPTASNGADPYGPYGPYWADGNRPAAFRESEYLHASHHAPNRGYHSRPVAPSKPSRQPPFFNVDSAQNIGSSFYSMDNGLRQHESRYISPPYFHNGAQEISASFSLFEDGSQTPTIQSASRSNSAQFKEKTLSWAHSIYIDLLSFLHQVKKEQRHARHAHGRSSSKANMYPRPPRQPASGFMNADWTNSSSSMSGSMSGHRTVSPRSQMRAGINGGDQQASRESYVQKHFAYIGGQPMQQSPHYVSPFKTSDNPGSPLAMAKEALEMLTNLCEQSNWSWIDGMLLGGCLAYGLEEYNISLEWNQRIVNIDCKHVQAICNLAATLFCLNRHAEAEQFWLRSIAIRPSYFEAVERLIGLLCEGKRCREAVDIIDSVEKALRLPATEDSQDLLDDNADRDSSASLSTSSVTLDYEDEDIIFQSPESRIGLSSTDAFGSSGYAVPSHDNGRILALVHAKGNMLYTLGEVDRASQAFEDAVLISAGRTFHGIQGLISRIIRVLSQTQILPPPPGPLLLPPDRAAQTAHLVFATHGDLPGLLHVPEGPAKKAAISTTSNSLLSLAKIFQDGMSNNNSPGRVSRTPIGVGDILALYYLSMSLQQSPSTANNVGILLASVPSPNPPRAVLEESDIPGVIAGSGIALALAYYNYGLKLDHNHAHLYTNLGSLLKDIGHLDAAIRMYERAVNCDSKFDIALANLANAVKDTGRTSDAIQYYKRAVASSPDFAEAVCGLANALNSVCDWAGRGGVLLDDGKQDRWHVNDSGMIMAYRKEGSGWMKRVVDIVARQLIEGSSWGRGALQGPNLIDFLQQVELADTGSKWAQQKAKDMESTIVKWVNQPWEGARILRLIERAIKRALHRWYHDKYITRTERQLDAYQRPRIPGSLAVPSAPTVLPFHTFTCPLSAKDIRMISQRNALRISCSTLRSPWMQGPVFAPPPPPAPHLNIGYVSSDFNNHPLAHLMQSVFGMHNPQRVKAFCYATTPSDKSDHRQQIEREAPVFHDASSWPPEVLVRQIVKDQIHILVNLNGYTRGARNEIFAARPAPIQMSFMGFAGTLGAEWCDYILADKTAIPPETLRPMRKNIALEDQLRDDEAMDQDDWVYSENVVFCKDTFFCCDHAQSEKRENQPSWDVEQTKRWEMRKELFPNLPEDAIILGNFNQLYKIEPTTFRTWLRILSNVPKAILWLLRFPDLGETNLKRTAREWAGQDIADRIWFTDVAPKHLHISRARVCDLFLDTPECNAHTTAADVLWSSTPLLTLPRYKYKMCSRMAASILKGALPKSRAGDAAAAELIARDDDEYERFAIRLAGGLSYRHNEKLGRWEAVGRLAELRKVLFEARWECALFDTRRWVRDLEDAYAIAWQRWVDDEGGDIYL